MILLELGLVLLDTATVPSGEHGQKWTSFFDKVVRDVILPWWSGEEDVYLWGALGCCTCRWSMGEVSWLLFKQCASVVMKDLIQMLQGMILHVHVGPLNNTTVAMMEGVLAPADARAVLILGAGPILGRSCLDWQSVAWLRYKREIYEIKVYLHFQMFLLIDLRKIWLYMNRTLLRGNDILSAYSQTLTDFE